MQILTSLFKNQKVIILSLGLDMIAKLKEHTIVNGSTGTSKTETLKRIANIYKIPSVIEDATSLSKTGYVGRDITDMLENLYLATGKDMEKTVALKSGARSLKTIFDVTISSAMFRIFAGEYSAINLIKPTNEERPYVLTKKRWLHFYFEIIFFFVVIVFF